MEMSKGLEKKVYGALVRALFSGLPSDRFELISRRDLLKHLDSGSEIVVLPGSEWYKMADRVGRLVMGIEGTNTPSLREALEAIRDLGFITDLSYTDEEERTLVSVRVNMAGYKEAFAKTQYWVKNFKSWVDDEPQCATMRYRGEAIADSTVAHYLFKPKLWNGLMPKDISERLAEMEQRGKNKTHSVKSVRSQASSYVSQNFEKVLSKVMGTDMEGSSSFNFMQLFYKHRKEADRKWAHTREGVTLKRHDSYMDALSEAANEIMEVHRRALLLKDFINKVGGTVALHEVLMKTAYKYMVINCALHITSSDETTRNFAEAVALGGKLDG